MNKFTLVVLVTCGLCVALPSAKASDWSNDTFDCNIAISKWAWGAWDTFAAGFCAVTSQGGCVINATISCEINSPLALFSNKYDCSTKGTGVKYTEGTKTQSFATVSTTQQGACEQLYTAFALKIDTSKK